MTRDRLKGLATFGFIVLFVCGFENAVYEWGYYRGHYAGQLAMKCAIFGAIDKLADAAKTRDERYSFVNLGCRTDAPAKARGQ